jgi:hypothetical protein
VTPILIHLTRDTEFVSLRTVVSYISSVRRGRSLHEAGPLPMR